MDNTRKNYIWNTLGTSLFSFNSLFLMIIVTRINGIEDGGVFSFAFATAGIINYFALYSGRTYQVANTVKEFTDSLFVFSRYLTSILAFIFALVFVLLNSYDNYKLSVILLLCLVKCLEALSDVYYGLLQKSDKLYIAGKSMTYKALMSLTVFLFVDIFTKNLVYSCISYALVNILFLIFYDYIKAKNEMKFKFDFKSISIMNFFKSAGYTFLFTLIIMVIINLPRYFIDYFLSNSDQGIYAIISMPATFIMLFSQFILQPSLLYLTKCFRQEEMKLFNKRVLDISAFILGSLLIILPCTYFLGIPILEIVYSVELQEYRNLLLLIVIGSAFYAVSNVFLNSLIILQNNKVQLYMQILILICSFVICYLLVSNGDIKKGILGYFIILLNQFIAYFLLYFYTIKKKRRGAL